MKTVQRVIQEAIDVHDPSQVILAVSGGYDSLCMAHYIYKNVAFDRPLKVCAINTRLAADGWVDWIDSTFTSFGWNYEIYDNQSGWEEYLTWVGIHGQPRTRRGHTYAYWRLKDRAFAAMLRNHKREWNGRKQRNDRVMFVTGVRREESTDRKNAPYIQRKKSAVWVNPIADWTADDILTYRLENGLPENPFYETVGGSGDCQCNWGRFITMRKLRKFSPDLAAGNVTQLDEVSRKNHGYGWDGIQDGQSEMFAGFDDESELTSPFLCDGCSRSKTPKPGMHNSQESRYLQTSMW